MTQSDRRAGWTSQLHCGRVGLGEARRSERGIWASASALALTALCVGLSVTPPARASDPQPAPNISAMEYHPIGKFGPAGQNTVVGGETPSTTIPPTNSPLTPTSGLRYNPSGEYVAYDTNLFETLTLPYRAAGDTADDDPPGNDFPPPGGGSPNYGQCDPAAAPDPDGFAPLTPLAGRCPNHHLEYLNYFEATMKDILGPFGVTVKRYPFQSPGSTNTKSGISHNIAAVVPGADHPEQTVIVSGHYDQTTEGPASAWDSAEGHAEVIRMAKIMADYWTATGTRPAATIKFAPWDQEESGLLGSADYVANNVVPGEEDKVRGYFNVDPCAGGYPAFYRGNPLDRVPLTMQLVDPALYDNDPDFQAEVEAFNARAETIVDEVFDHLDDNLSSPTAGPGGPHPIYVSDAEAAGGGPPSQRDEVETAVGGLLLFTSDYTNFEAIGVPFMNMGPGFFGPSADGNPNRDDGIAMLHTPNDNHRTVNGLTSTDQTGLTASEGWAKGMELCAHLESWYMLQPEMAGGQTANQSVVAYYEALPNEATRFLPVSFDASGSYQYGATPGSFVPESSLSYSWDFGDGTTGTGKTPQHTYTRIGRYMSTLTVTNTSTGQSDTMTIPITVIDSTFQPPVLEQLPAEDADGEYTVKWTFAADREGFQRFAVDEAKDFQTLLFDDAEGPLSDRWSASDPDDPGLSPWQASDSSTAKVRGNQASSDERSYWTGVSPPDLPGPQNQLSALTLKNPIDVPTAREPLLSYASLFQSEGDDQGRVEVAVTDGTTPADQLQWEPIDIVAAKQTALGTTDRAICDPSRPETFSTDFEQRTASLEPYRNQKVLIRFLYRLGPDDRALSQPCGWYVDDIRVSTGTFEEIGTTTDENFRVTNRPAGAYAYRVFGVYDDDIRTAASNVVVTRVIRGDCANPIKGTKGKDRLKGTSADETIRGGGGNDKINGRGGADCLSGQSGKDRLLGGGGNDDIKGGRAKDVLKGGGGDDKLRVRRGGRDRVNCGPGKDVVFANRKRDQVAKNCEKVRKGG